MSKVVNLYKGDCLTEHERIESDSVDLILCDPPYGTMKDAPSTWDADKTKWDMALYPSDLFEIANRILRRNGKLVLFSQEPYTSRLITEAIPNMPFSYRMIWEKDTFANHLGANKAPVSYYEDILVFSKTHDTNGLHPLREYSLKLRVYTNYSRSRFYKILGHGGAQHFLEGNKESSQFALCTEKTYEELIDVFNIDKMDGFKTYEELREIDRRFKAEAFPSIFNLPLGAKYKSNILRYKKDYDGYHPTQKPVALLDDLIRTYSNEGNHVVDLTMGSGSTGVASVNTGRKFTGIEMDDTYFNTAKKRIYD